MIRPDARPHVRRAGPLDCGPMADLLNEVIRQGGTTAETEPVTSADLAARMRRPDREIWHLAEDEGGRVLGVQHIHPHPGPGEDVAQIATFTRQGRAGPGIGSALFEATTAAARAAGYASITAEIRADNASGLTYYQSRGFEDHGRVPAMRLADGTVVDKVLKRFDLD